MKNTFKIVNNVILIFFFFYTMLSFAQKEESKEAPKTIAELKTAIENIMEEEKIPAVGIALVDKDGLVWVAGLGKANIENNVEANENTMFRIGSVSKMFVSLAILKLQEEGRVSLKDKVRDLVPDVEFKNPWAETSPILVEHLLEHTTGWDDFHPTEYALSIPKIKLKDALDYHPHSRTSRWVPGTRMSYCNSGPAVAAYIIEKITGQIYEDYIQENFFDPMGMETMTFFESATYKKLGATLYKNGKPQDYWYLSERPSGSINASPIDMAKMALFFIKRGRVDSLQLVSNASLKRMETSKTTIGAKTGLENGYGLTNFQSSLKNFVYRGHSGSVGSGHSSFYYLPDHHLGYAIMINSGNIDGKIRIVKLVQGFQTKDLDYKTDNSKPFADTKENNISGWYIPINPRMQNQYFYARILGTQKIWKKNDTIFKKSLFGGETQSYLPINKTQYISPKTGKVSMVRAKDPLAGNVLESSFVMLKPTSPVLVFGQLIIIGLWVFGIISSLIFGIIWAIRYWRGKISGAANIWVRLWPIIASLLVILIIIQTKYVFDSFEAGKVNFLSISYFIATIAFALVSAWSVFYIIKKRHKKINRKVYWYSAVLSALHLIVTFYLLWYGFIGIRLWS